MKKHNYKLYRELITKDNPRYHPFVIMNHGTHIISLEYTDDEGVKYGSQSIIIFPEQLKSCLEMLMYDIEVSYQEYNNKAEFLLTNVKIEDRYIHRSIGDIRNGTEVVTLTVELIGSGNTKSISNKRILDVFFDKLESIKNS